MRVDVDSAGAVAATSGRYASTRNKRARTAVGAAGFVAKASQNDRLADSGLRPPKRSESVFADAFLFPATASLIGSGASCHVSRVRVGSGVDGSAAAATFSSTVSPRTLRMLARTSGGVDGFPYTAALTEASRLSTSCSSAAGGADGFAATALVTPRHLSPAKAPSAADGVLGFRATSSRRASLRLRASRMSFIGLVFGSCAAAAPSTVHRCHGDDRAGGSRIGREPTNTRTPHLLSGASALLHWTGGLLRLPTEDDARAAGAIYVFAPENISG